MNKKYFIKAMDIAHELDKSLYMPLPEFKVLSLESDTSDIDNLNTDQIENDSEFKIDPANTKPEAMIKNSIEITNITKELNDNNQELEKTITSTEDLLNSLFASEELLRSSRDNISPMDVSKACYYFNKQLDFLGTEADEYRNLHNVNADFFSKENDPGITPAQALNIVTEDMKEILSKTKDRIKAIWEMIINALKKLWEMITSFFGSIKKSAMKLKQEVEKNYPTKPTGKFQPYKHIPSLLYINHGNKQKLAKINLEPVDKIHKGAMTYALTLSNLFVTFLKQNPNNPDHQLLLDKLYKYHTSTIAAVDGYYDERNKEKFAYFAVGAKYSYRIFLKMELDKFYYKSLIKVNYDGENKFFSYKDDLEIDLLTRTELIRFLDFIIQYDKKSFVNNIKEARKNTEYLKENSNIGGFVITQIGNYIYSHLTSKIVKAETDFLKGLYKVCELSYKLGLKTEDQDEHIDVDPID